MRQCRDAVLQHQRTRRCGQALQSVVLCGVRDVRDYRIHSSTGKSIVTDGSAFNFKSESLRLRDFSPQEVEALLAQHTRETGQVFDPDAGEAIWTLTRGQPWLVNALAYQACFRGEDPDRSRPVTFDVVRDAGEQLVLRRDTHLDQLADKLREERVRRVVEPVLSGETPAGGIPDDDGAEIVQGMSRGPGPESCLRGIMSVSSLTSRRTHRGRLHRYCCGKRIRRPVLDRAMT